MVTRIPGPQPDCPNKAGHFNHQWCVCGKGAQKRAAEVPILVYSEGNYIVKRYAPGTAYTTDGGRSHKGITYHIDSHGVRVKGRKI